MTLAIALYQIATISAVLTICDRHDHSRNRTSISQHITRRLSRNYPTAHQKPN